MATFNLVLRRRGVWPQWRNGEGWKLVDDDGNTVIPREPSNGTGDPSRLEKVVDMAIEEAMQQHSEATLAQRNFSGRHPEIVRT